MSLPTQTQQEPKPPPSETNEGNLLTKESQQLERWRVDFEEILNWPPPNLTPDIVEATEDLNTNCSWLSDEAIKQATEIPKKGNISECKNWRVIMLLSIPSKILFRIILDRILHTLDKRLRQEQASFRKDYSCTEHIATLRIIDEQCTE